MEDSAFGFIKMKNGATIFLESAWAINMKESREASCTLCGTKAGAEIIGGMSKAEGEYDLVFNKTDYGQLTEETLSAGGTIAFFEAAPTSRKRWSASSGWRPSSTTVSRWSKPEQAFTVTKILDNIYKSAAQGKRSSSPKGKEGQQVYRNEKKGPKRGVALYSYSANSGLKRTGGVL